MPPDAQLDSRVLDRITIVLVAPRNPLNIGAAARAMANFGFTNLTVVAPYEPSWRQAKSAIGAESLLESACVVASLNEAVASATFVLGTASLDVRQPELPVVSLPDLAPLVEHELAKGARIALVFGQEKRGLTGDDLALCHRLLTIPTHSAQPSMNLGQAVAVCLYELSKNMGAPDPGSPGTGLSPRGGGPSHSGTWDGKHSEANIPATSARHDQLSGLIDEIMHAVDYSPATMRASNRHDTELLLRRLSLTDSDGRRILGFLRRILWKLKH